MEPNSIWNFKLNAVYTIGILDNEVFHHEIQSVDKNTEAVFYDKLTYVYLEMLKFKKTATELETHFLSIFNAF